MATGTIRKLMKDRGFGFIRTPEGNDVFFHRSDCRQVDFDALSLGQRLEFEELQAPRGARAANLRMGAGQPEAARGADVRPLAAAAGARRTS